MKMYLFSLYSTTIFIKISLLASVYAHKTEPDHYWDMNIIKNGLLLDSGADKIEWNGRTKGASAIVSTPFGTGVSLQGPNSWIDFCADSDGIPVVPQNYPEGISLTVWVNVALLPPIQQTILVIGRLKVVTERNYSAEAFSVNYYDATQNKTWMTRSRGFTSGVWHHVGMTWNFTKDIQFYLNGSRINVTVTETTARSFNQSQQSSKDQCSMNIGKDAQRPQHAAMIIDDLKIWRSIINDSDVEQDYLLRPSLPAMLNGCRGQWKPYLESCYRYFNILKSTTAARQRCASDSSDIVSVKDKRELEFLRSTILYNLQSDCVYLAKAKAMNDKYLSNVFGLRNSDSEEEKCVFMNQSGCYEIGNCSRKCTFVCKKDRDNMYHNARFSCASSLPTFQNPLNGQIVYMISVRSEMECAIQCLLYGEHCKSFNYQTKGGLCELHEHRGSTFILYKKGFNLCTRW